MFLCMTLCKNHMFHDMSRHKNPYRWCYMYLCMFLHKMCNTNQHSHNDIP